MTGLRTYFGNVVKSFVLVFFVSGVLAGVVWTVKKNSLDGFGDGLLFGIMMAVVVVPVVVLLDLVGKIRVFTKYKAVDFAVKQKRVFRLEAEYMSSFEEVKTLLMRIGDICACENTGKKSAILVETRKSWRSFGEKIRVELRDQAGSSVFGFITSEPKSFITLIDYSKNLENVEKFLQELSKTFSVTVGR